MKKLSFLIINYFTSQYVKDLVESINENVLRFEYEILIYDNSCNKDEAIKIKLLESKQIFTFISEKNLGFVKGNNILLSNAKGDIIVLINPDTVLIDQSLENLFNYLSEDTNIAAAGPMLLNRDLTYQVSFFKFPNLKSLFLEHILLFQNNVYAYNTDIYKMQYCDVVKGACIILNKDFLENGQIFDEDFTMYSEETELCFRIKASNKKVLYYPNARIIHYGEKSSSKKFATEYSLFHYYRSKLILFQKYYKKYKMNLAQLILFTSLIEKTIILYLLNKKESSIIHFNVYRKLRKNVKDLSNL